MDNLEDYFYLVDLCTTKENYALTRVRPPTGFTILFLLILLLKFAFETRSFSLVLSPKESRLQFFCCP
jgi:hypothetical protein